MMINVVTGETRRLLLPLNLGLDQERSYGFKVIGDQLFAPISRSYTSQHWVQVVNLAELLAGADEEDVSKAAYFRWRGQLIAIDDVIDLRIPAPAPNHELTTANVIFDKSFRCGDYGRIFTSRRSRPASSLICKCAMQAPMQ